ncbi:hypothetical protein AXG93_2571s1020 [Marchantia polymorpha subsp. ruderalis]|uniref:Uncharacterized protein n=1 Tax=Marchantia polymorpha subsp. ruderalis TaxID=1480154 RepID=A0A176VFA2_MARPO|nr:hypothetical protein AXG93_2571s1020 [Marchantia polymorpha subsp. ruderalis]
MASWQVGFVELALAGAPIHWARIVWKATRQHAGEEEPRKAWAPRKQEWEGDAELSRRELLAVPVRRRANNEQARPEQKACKLILPADSSADTKRAAVARDSPSSEEDRKACGNGQNAYTREMLAFRARAI